MRNAQMTRLASRGLAGGKGFSLVEILAVVAIIAVLFALVVPLSKTLSRTRNDARCINNLRQLGIAAQSYIADNNGVLRSMYGGKDASTMWTRSFLLGGYLNASVEGANDTEKLLHQIDSVGSVMRCPSGEVGPTYSREFPARWVWQTYGMGMFDPEFEIRASQGPTGYTGIYEVPVSRVAKPSAYILFADSAVSNANREQTFRISRVQGEGGLDLRHKNRAHAVFLDGHAEAIDRERATELKVPNPNIFDKK